MGCVLINWLSRVGHKVFYFVLILFLKTFFFKAKQQTSFVFLYFFPPVLFSASRSNLRTTMHFAQGDIFKWINCQHLKLELFHIKDLDFTPPRKDQMIWQKETCLLLWYDQLELTRYCPYGQGMFALVHPSVLSFPLNCLFDNEGPSGSSHYCRLATHVAV